MTKKTIYILLILLFTQNIFAQTSTEIDTEFRTKIKSASSTLRTIQADFVQVKKAKNITKTVESKGVFYYDNQSLMAMHYTEPKGDKVVMRGEGFVIVTSGKRVVANAKSNPMMGQISNMMLSCMSGDVSKFGKGWNMTVERHSSGYKVTLKPTDKRVAKYISAMTMVFRASDMTLDMLQIDETSGGYTQYTFTNKRLNQPIDPSVFKMQ